MQRRPHLVTTTARAVEHRSDQEVTSPMSPVEQMASMGLDHNAWADEEDEFGNKREIRMTFE